MSNWHLLVESSCQRNPLFLFYHFSWRSHSKYSPLKGDFSTGPFFCWHLLDATARVHQLQQHIPEIPNWNPFCCYELTELDSSLISEGHFSSLQDCTLPFIGVSSFPTALVPPTWFGVELYQESPGLWPVLVVSSLLSIKRFNVSMSFAAAVGGYCQNAPHQLLCFPASSKLMFKPCFSLIKWKTLLQCIAFWK